MSEGFFSRWSRRKQESGQGVQSPDAGQVPAPVGVAPPSEPETRPVDLQGRAPQGTAPQASMPDATGDLPTLEDVQDLTPQSDFQPFMQRGVGTEVRNAAMKKLFADPHFNLMDGLDIYIDDYSQPDPMPAGMLAKMASAQFLKLVPEAVDEAERPAQDPPASAEPGASGQVVAQSPDPSASAETEPHDHPDLQLQPDPAPGHPDAGPCPR